MDKEQIAIEIKKIKTTGIDYEDSDKKSYEMKYLNDIYICNPVPNSNKWEVCGEIFNQLKQIKKSIVLGELSNTEYSEDDVKIEPQYGSTWDCLDANAILVYVLTHGLNHPELDIKAEIKRTVLNNAYTAFVNGQEIIDEERSGQDLADYIQRVKIRAKSNELEKDVE